MLKGKLFSTNSIEKSAYIWNTSASMLNAFQTVLILMVISRIDPLTDAGIFTIAFAIGNLMLTIGLYGTRQFQVSDVNNKYSFHDYFVARSITCLIMIIVSVVYVSIYFVDGTYTTDKSLIIILVCLTKSIDALEDVFHGMFQQQGRLNVAGKILFSRLACYIIMFLCVYIGTKNLVAASLVSFIVSVTISLVLNGIALNSFSYDNKDTALSHIIKLLMECFPLFISSYLTMYIINAPKYAIDKVLDNESQACFNYIFMPVFVIGLMSQFVYQPIIGKLSLIWHKREIKKFHKLILRQGIIIGALSAFVLLCGYLLGIPVLSILFHVELSNYKNHFVILLSGGIFLAYIYFFQMIMTVIRQQNLLTINYCLIYLVFLGFGNTVVRDFGLMGISLFYMLALAVLALTFLIIVIIKTKVSSGKTHY